MLLDLIVYVDSFILYMSSL